MDATLPATRLGYRPALDGLRGVAIALVVLSHINRAWVGLGIVGVVLFFVLSGFLITTLLVEEHRAAGRISLPAFYARRARRLFPALAAYLVVVTPLALWLWPQDANIASALSTVLYVANWHQADDPAGVGAFGQMWSLGIEEQFYLTWPLLLIGLLAVMRPRRAALVALAIGVSSALLRFALASDDAWVPLFFQTPYRLDAILLGCALALWFVPAGRLWVGLPLLVGAAFLGTGTAMLAFGLLLAAVGSVMLVAAAMQGRPRWLTWRPLIGLGKISYGLYLWHAPFVVALDAAGAPIWLRAIIIPAGGIVAALASYWWVERPFMRLKSRIADRPVVMQAVSASTP